MVIIYGSDLIFLFRSDFFYSNLNFFAICTSNNISIIASPNYVTDGACSTGTNDTSWISIGTNPGTILWKSSGHWDICTVKSDTVNLAVHIPTSQAVGLYTGTLTLNMPF